MNILYIIGFVALYMFGGAFFIETLSNFIDFDKRFAFSPDEYGSPGYILFFLIWPIILMITLSVLVGRKASRLLLGQSND